MIREVCIHIYMYICACVNLNRRRIQEPMGYLDLAEFRAQFFVAVIYIYMQIG